MHPQVRFLLYSQLFLTQRIYCTLAYSHWYPACASEPMSGNDSTATTTSVRAYQGVKIYDGTDPTAYNKPWRAKILSHYGTWLNGEAIAGIWQEHIVDDGVFTARLYSSLFSLPAMFMVI